MSWRQAYAGHFYVADLGFILGQGTFDRYRVLNRFGAPLRSFRDDPFGAKLRSGRFDPPRDDGAIGWIEPIGCPDEWPQARVASVTRRW